MKLVESIAKKECKINCLLPRSDLHYEYLRWVGYEKRAKEDHKNTTFTKSIEEGKAMSFKGVGE